LASSSTVLRHVHVFLGLPLPPLLWGFHSRDCLAMSSGGFRNVWPSHPDLCFLIYKSVLSCLVCFHSSLFVIWSRPDNSQYFRLYFLSGPARKFSIFSSLFLTWSGQKILNIFLFISYLDRPENSQYFPLYSLPGPARKFSIFCSLFLTWSGQKILNIFLFIPYLFQPENSQYFPLYSLPGPVTKFSIFSSLFVIWSG